MHCKGSTKANAKQKRKRHTKRKTKQKGTSNSFYFKTGKPLEPKQSLLLINISFYICMLYIHISLYIFFYIYLYVMLYIFLYILLYILLCSPLSLVKAARSPTKTFHVKLINHENKRINHYTTITITKTYSTPWPLQTSNDYLITRHIIDSQAEITSPKVCYNQRPPSQTTYKVD